MTVKKEDLLRFMQGQLAAGEVIEQERKNRLQRLTPDQAREEYDNLCMVWRHQSSSAELNSLKEQHVQYLINLRKKFNQRNRP